MAPTGLKASVALLTKNGGDLVRRCVAAVAAQRFDDFEIIAIDSGSRDGTAEFLSSHSRVRFRAIAAHEFQHGATRNMAMAMARGELVAFLTQDAVPAHDEWLSALVEFMEWHPDVAGAFGHQVAHPDADPLEAWEVTCHFESFRARGVHEFRKPVQRLTDEAQRARAHYFSNVNSCIRRAAWERVPFPEVDFGEDQAWARDVQEAGWATGYAQNAVVFHSHNYPAWTLLRRRYDEARFMKRQFGYSLIPTWASAVQNARALRRMYSDHFASSPPPPGLPAPVRSVVRAWASTLGRWAGTRWADDEGPLHAALSLAERHRKT